MEQVVVKNGELIGSQDKQKQLVKDKLNFTNRVVDALENIVIMVISFQDGKFPILDLDVCNHLLFRSSLLLISKPKMSTLWLRKCLHKACVLQAYEEKQLKMVYYYFETFFNCFDKICTVPRYKLKHVNDDNDVISKAESEKRIFWIIFIFALFLNLGICFMISIFISLNKEINVTEYDEEILMPVLQKLVLILSDGTTLFLYMTKSLELKIAKIHKFNYDPCGFFAYYQNGHIQTLVGNTYELNYIYDSNFDSKAIQGKKSIFKSISVKLSLLWSIIFRKSITQKQCRF